MSFSRTRGGVYRKPTDWEGALLQGRLKQVPGAWSFRGEEDGGCGEKGESFIRTGELPGRVTLVYVFRLHLKHSHGFPSRKKKTSRQKTGKRGR